MTPSTPPSISVVVPTKNRCAMLCDCVRALLAQSVPVEIVVMNDASTDDTEATVRREFPGVRVVTSPISRGPAYQRNAGARATSGTYLFTIDDDCILVDPDTLRQTVGLFDDPRIAGVTVPFVNVLRNTHLYMAAPDLRQTYVQFDYYGGMVGFRRADYLAVGGYRESIFYNGEEADLALRLLQRRRFIRPGSAPPLHHMESAVRDEGRIFELWVRNNVLYAVHNVPWPDVAWALPGTVCRSFVKAWRTGRMAKGVQGLASAMHDLPAAWASRQPVPPNVYRFARALRRRPMTLDEADGRLYGTDPTPGQ